jgi:DNA polymerase sigma
MARARRRVPYSLGPDKLEAEVKPLKEHLNPAEDEKLSGDMRELYDRLQPSAESEERRGYLLKKLEKLLNDKWPGHSIQVVVFGSSGNQLGTTDSDVDICITTDWTELDVCALAELLASSGMERVVCVSSAKVPIVKCWDPVLQLACDLNVNNTVALENTELIRAYVSLDDRVRPLAMIIKHWTRRRMLNDAGRQISLTCRLVLTKESAWRNAEFICLDLHDNQLSSNSRPTSTACPSTSPRLAVSYARRLQCRL